MVRIPVEFLVVGTVFLIAVSGFAGALAYAFTSAEHNQLEQYCDYQDIELDYNNSIRATEQGLVIECVKGGEVEQFVLTASRTQEMEQNSSAGDGSEE